MGKTYFDLISSGDGSGARGDLPGVSANPRRRAVVRGPRRGRRVCLQTPISPCATINGAIVKANPGETIWVAMEVYTHTGASDAVVSIDYRLNWPDLGRPQTERHRARSQG